MTSVHMVTTSGASADVLSPSDFRDLNTQGTVSHLISHTIIVSISFVFKQLYCYVNSSI